MNPARLWRTFATLSWFVLPIAAGPAISSASSGAGAHVPIVVAVGSWACWSAGLLASLVASTASLTAWRLVSPLPVVAMVIAAVAGASGAEVALGLTVSVGALILVWSAEVGEVFVQGSAYGDERRLPLRPPPSAALALGALWTVAVAAIVLGALTAAGERWWGLAPLGVGIAIGVAVVRGGHRLSRRFVVLVPAGFVVHDHLVLADTALMARASIAHVGLAEAGTTATDLTGGTPGLAVEVTLVDPQPIVLAGSRQQPGGQGRVVDAFLVAPSRPGRVLTAAAERRLPVDA